MQSSQIILSESFQLCSLDKPYFMEQNHSLLLMDPIFYFSG